jgi:TonB family protein
VEGKAGNPKAKPASGRRAVAGEVKEPHDVAGEIRNNSILKFLDGPISGDLGAVMDDKPALGPDAKTVLGDLTSTNVAEAYGTGLGLVGTGAGGGGTGLHTVGTGEITTLGKYGRGPGGGPGYGWGPGVGRMGPRHASTPDVLPGTVTTHGNLDKEIIRRIVRRHLNEVKYCYDQALVRQPKLEGRLVAQFTIAGTGQVIASVRQSSTLGAPAAEMCVVNAIKRWQFPAPMGGGLAIVTYPFTFSPAGN